MVDFSKIPSPQERAAERAARSLRVVFTGSRDWTQVSAVRVVIERLVGAGCKRVAHGAARGLDAIVDAEAKRRGDLHVEPYPAHWRPGGGPVDRTAGINRNLTMLMREEPHLVVAFPHVDSVGTWHCAVAAECPALVCLLGAGVRDAIAAQAREWGLDPAKREEHIRAWVSERVRETVAKSRGLLSWPDVSIPVPGKAWALLTPRTSEPEDVCTRAVLDALLA